LIDLGACHDAVEWARGYDTPEAAWAACERGDWMLWICGKLAGPPWSDSRKPLVLACCECARLTLPYVHVGEDRPRSAIETAERWARGEVAQEEVRAATSAAYAAATSAAYAAAAASAYAAYAASAYAASAADAYAADAAAAASADSAAAAYAAAYAAAASAAAYAAADAAAAAAAYAAADAATYAAAYAAAAAAAAYSAADATAARTTTLRACADIVRQHYPKPPKIKAGKETT
jgi:hypothetical protein